jgi:hypothetical protein
MLEVESIIWGDRLWRLERIKERRKMMAVIHQPMNRRAFAIAGLGAVVSLKATLAQSAAPASPVPADGALYRINLPASSLPPAPVSVGAVGVTMSPGTTALYPEGAAGRSVAIDHILAGNYEIESDSEIIHISAAGNVADVESGVTLTVATGETIILLQNEAAQRITAGDQETHTLTFGFFSLDRGTHESIVEGTVEQDVLGGTVLFALPEFGVTVAVIPADDASGLTNSVVQVPATLATDEQWVVVVLPLAEEATPVV